MAERNKNTKGSHLLIDLVNLDTKICLNSSRWLDSFVFVAESVGLNIISKTYHQFVPPAEPGFTAFILLDSSHFSIHTYANEKKAALDLFACTSDLNKAFKLLKKSLGIKEDNISFFKEVRRFNDGY